MPTPEFILRLRERVGHEPLWLVGVTAVVMRGDSTLLVQRADSGDWSPVAGIVEPGEHTADTAEREVLEEASVVARVERLAAVTLTPEFAYANGDRTQFTNLTYLLRHVSGEPAVGDDESTDARWFPIDALPPMPERYAVRLRHALAGGDVILERTPES